MKILRTIVLCFSALLIFSTSANAQLFQFGLGGGITQVLAPEQYTNPVSDGGYGFSTEYNFGVVAKLGLPALPLTPKAYFLYHVLYGTGDYNNVNGLEYDQTISELGVGIEYEFIPVPAGISPYVALDIAYNSFSALEMDASEVPNTQANRFGFGLGVGSEFSIIPVIDIDVYATYKMFNLIGKEDGEENVTAFVLDAFITLNFL
jgi:hypothetical protein